MYVFLFTLFHCDKKEIGMALQIALFGGSTYTSCLIVYIYISVAIPYPARASHLLVVHLLLFVIGIPPAASLKPLPPSQSSALVAK